MNSFAIFDRRPVLVAVAGPNGAGKTTFYHAHLKSTGLRFVNADVVAGQFGLDPYAAARLADALRRALLKRKESFVFETVFSDPAGDKRSFLREAAESGYTVVLCFIGVANPKISEERVAMRVSQGGHDVPTSKLKSRYARILANLKAALKELPHVRVFDNSDLRSPFKRVAEFEGGRRTYLIRRAPKWFTSVME